MKTKKTLADEFFALKPEQRRLVHFALGEYALEKWQGYVKTHKKIEYLETVTGTRQSIDKQLPADALIAAKEGLDLLNVAQRYQEPIVAMQDDDLVLPESVSLGYYAIYNLFKKYAGQQAVDDWLIVNQALASEENSTRWVKLLNAAMQTTKR